MTELSRRSFIVTTSAAAMSCGLASYALAGAGEEHTYEFMVDPSKCIGCIHCVKACILENDVPEHNFRTWIERYTFKKDQTFIVESPNGGLDGFGEPDVDPKDIKKAVFIPKLCNQCDNTPCLQVCPVGATYMGPEGLIHIDSEHCIGCGYCIQSCPYGARFYNHETGAADKCDWCYHRISKGMVPACVEVCPTEARRFSIDGSDPLIASEKNEGNTRGLRQSIGTEPKLAYLGLEEKVR
ncbi:MAG: 4Fe-4S dicluster domain-containing protein [Planctomycetes bacterium]|nr:4Fe-4S dicluster domain-containing protein [Planctomycetota bacterium]